MYKQQSKKFGAVVLASSLVFSSIAPTIYAAPNPGKAEVATGRTELNKITGLTTLNPIPARVDNASTVQLSGTVVIDGPKLELKVNGNVVNAETKQVSDKTWSFKYVHPLNSENLSEKKDEQITVEANTVYPNGKNAGAVHTSAQPVSQTVDLTPPDITFNDYNKDWTNKSITVFASINEKGTLNATSHSFDENGSFEFVATDLAGNVTRHTVHITNIDKVAPEITVKPYNTEWTNQNITVEVSMNEEGELNTTSHTFTENGTFTFIATDRAGNVTELPVTISNIDKVAPEIIIEEYITSPTNKDITVKVSMNEPGTLNEEIYTFVENGEFEFIATDLAGNETKKKIVISNIDKVAPVITVFSYNTSPTNQDVIVTAETNEGTLNETSHTFTENGSFDFIATDEAGNVTVETITITNIDKTPPVITVNPYNTDPTNQDVVVTVTTNEGKLNTTTHTFEGNGEFSFVATDEAGNVTVVTITITNIDKTPPVVSNVDNGFSYNTNVAPTFNEGTALLNGVAFTSGTTVSIEGSYILVVTDAVGNESTVSFTIDITAPVVSGVGINQYYNVDVTPTFNEGMATLDGNTFLSGAVVSAEGTHTLVVRDEAGNETIVTFTIDKTKPALTNVTAKTIQGQVKTTTVSGDAEPGAAVEVYLKNSNGTKGSSLGRTTVKPDDSFSVSFTEVKNNTDLIVTATDKANNTFEVTVTVKNN